MTKIQPKIARQFSTQRHNQRRNLVFNGMVSLLLVFVLMGTLIPHLVRLGAVVENAWTNFKTNISPHKVEALNPLAVPFNEKLTNLVDKSIFEPKDFKEMDPYTMQVTAVNGVVAIFSKQEELEGQISSLQSLLVKSRIESKKVVRVDLRFNKIVVEYDTNK